MTQSVDSPLSSQSLCLGQQLSYVAPVMTVWFLWGPMGVLQGIYAKYYGITLGMIAVVLLISQLFDAVTDPLIGYWSDQCQAKMGTRKPFVVVGGVLFIISSYFLYVPVDPNTVDVSTTVSPVYFLCWFLLFYLAFTLLEIPHLAWAAELSPSAESKNKIYSLRFLSGSLGTLCFFLVPFLPIFLSRDITPHTLRWATLVAGMLMFLALLICVFRTPNGPVVRRNSPMRKETLREIGSEIVGNKPLLVFIAAFLLFSGGSSMYFSLIYIVVDSYLELGHHYALVVLIGVASSILILGVWYWLANHVGKKIVLGLSAFLYGAGAFGTSFLEPGQAGLLSLSLVMVMAYMSAISAVAPSMLAEIIDYGTWKFGVDRSATYFSVFAFSAKAALAFGSSIALWIVSWYGFDPVLSEQTARAVFGLHLAACWLPALLMLSSIVAFGLIPMNRYRHRIIHRRLDAMRWRDAKSKLANLDAVPESLKALEPTLQ